MFRSLARVHLALLASVSALAVACGSWGQANPGVPPQLEGVDIIERLGSDLPLELEFVDQSGDTIKLGDLFQGDRPVLLQMGYYKCPQLCNLVLNEMTDTLKNLEWTTGDEFDVLSISINPEESHELAAAKRTSYVLMYERRNSGSGWNFLVGPGENSKAVADTVGFQFRKQPDGEYAHAAGLFVLTPEGTISRYLYGATHDPKTVRLALLEAADGRIGSTLDRFILWCHVYDPSSGSYVLFAVRLMQLGGILTLLVLGTGLGWMWLADRRRSHVVCAPGSVEERPDTPAAIHGVER